MMTDLNHVNDDRAADAHQDTPVTPAAAPEPGACPFCGGNIRGVNWFYHCDGCGFNWSNLAQINFDRVGVESRNGTA